MIVGALAMVVGAIDPLEGSVVVLPGSGLALVGLFLAQPQGRLIRFMISAFIAITFGVVAMFILSALGGIGGSTGRSMWWGLFVLPYPIGWAMGIVSLVVRLVGSFRHRTA
jgi:hypothetical protein